MKSTEKADRLEELLLLTRRDFIRVGGISSVGIAFSTLPVLANSLHDAPFLDGDDEAARGPGFLVLNWKTVTDVKQIDIVLQSNAGTDIRTNAKPGKLVGLKPNRLYAITLRITHTDDSSELSDSLKIRTRLPKPDPPKHGVDDFDVQGIALEWDVTSVLNGVDDSTDVKVLLGRKNLSGKIIPISPAKHLADKFFDHNHGNVNFYHLMLTCSISFAPNGKNISSWSDELILSKQVVAAVEIPGQDRSKSSKYLRNFYARQ